jgi:hypothetical protein
MMWLTVVKDNETSSFYGQTRGWHTLSEGGSESG